MEKYACAMLLIVMSWFCVMTNCNVTCPPEERHALLTLKEDYPAYSLPSWQGSNCCTWDGVECSNPTSHVIKLDLAFMTQGGNASHTLSAALFGLKHLQYLDFSYNGLGGVIPPGISVLKELRHLDLAYNNLEGGIPKSLGSLNRLSYLSMSYCDLSGPIPNTLVNLTSLSYLDLSDNHFSGPFPLSLSRLPRLKELGLHGNDLLSGDISQILDGEWPQLSVLSLRGSNITGSIPPSVGNLSSLTYLSLTYMNIEGHIPSTIGNLSALQVLDLHANSLKGEIPTSLGCLPLLYDIELSSNNLEDNVSFSLFQNNTSLHYLDLSHNQLTVHIDSAWIPQFYYIQGLHLASCNIGGTIPPFLSTQYQLHSLDLSNNNIFGSIPTWIGEYKWVYLNLSFNNLEGQFPSSLDISSGGYFNTLDLHSNMLIGSLPIPSMPSYGLQVLDLSNNRFTGVIREEIGMLLPVVQFLSFSANNLSGGIPISIGHLQKLEVLDLSNNALCGKTPPTITNCSALKRLNLANTHLEGEFPSAIGRLGELKTLHLNDNMLSGNLPPSLANCSQLQILEVGKNFLSGKIPVWLAQFPQLMILILRYNQFQGCIPHELGNLSSLHVLDLSHNSLICGIPPELAKLTAMKEEKMKSLNDSEHSRLYYKEEIQVITKELPWVYVSSVLLLITCIDLSGNKLSGFIPSEIGELKGLHTLNFSRNNLTGEIPKGFAMLKQLESLDLSCNKLEGKIPNEMLQVHSLAFFIVSNNKLCGRIPEGGQFWTFKVYYFSGNPCLCGFPLNAKCGPKNSVPYSPREEEEDANFQVYWYVGWVASYAFGFWGVFMPIIVKRTWRKKYFQVIDGIIIRLANKIK